MPENLRRFLFFLPEALSVFLFAGVCIVAQAVPATLAGVSLPKEAKSVPAIAALLFFFLQRQHCRELSASTFPAAVHTLARFNATRMFIPAVVFVTTWYGIYLRGVTPTAAGLFGLAVSAFAMWLVQRPSASRRSLLRGTDVLSHQAARAKVAGILRPDEETLVWGALTIPERFSEGHFCVVGAVGSGKTLTLRHLMQSVLPHIGERPDSRALIYDAKRDMLSILSGMKLACPVVVLNPFDARSSAWDMARDLTDPASSREIADILIPEKQNDQNPFYTNAAQTIFAGVLKSFMLTAPGEWTLRDVLSVAASPARLRKVLSAAPETEAIIEQLFEPENTFRNTLQTIAAATAVLEPVAALWHRCPRKFSLTEWVNSNAILVLGTDWTYTKTLKAINRLLFKRLSQLVLNASESRTRRTWFFLDELKETGNLDGLPSLLSYGRSKGVRVAVAFQDIDGLRRPEAYGEKTANEIVGLFANKSILRTDSEATARWAAQVIGEQLGSEYTTSRTSGPQGNSTGTTEHIFKRDAVLPSEIMRLPPADESSFAGYHVVPGIGVYSARWFYQQGLCKPGAADDFVKRPVPEQLLAPWANEDERRFARQGPQAETSPAEAGPSPLTLISRMSRAAKDNGS